MDRAVPGRRRQSCKDCSSSSEKPTEMSDFLETFFKISLLLLLGLVLLALIGVGFSFDALLDYIRGIGDWIADLYDSLRY